MTATAAPHLLLLRRLRLRPCMVDTLRFVPPFSHVQWECCATRSRMRPAHLGAPPPTHTMAPCRAASWPCIAFSSARPPYLPPPPASRALSAFAPLRCRRRMLGWYVTSCSAATRGCRSCARTHWRCCCRLSYASATGRAPSGWQHTHRCAGPRHPWSHAQGGNADSWAAVTAAGLQLAVHDRRYLTGHWRRCPGLFPDAPWKAHPIATCRTAASGWGGRRQAQVMPLDCALPSVLLSAVPGPARLARSAAGGRARLPLFLLSHAGKPVAPWGRGRVGTRTSTPALLARLALGRCHHWRAVFTRSLQASVSKLSGLSTRALSRVLACLVELRAPPPAWWLEQMLSSSLRVLHLGSQADAAAMLYHACRLNVRLSPAWLHEVLCHARGVRRWPPPNLKLHPRAGADAARTGSGAAREAAHVPAGAVGMAGAAAPDGLDAASVVRVLYVVAREREDSRVVPHVAWARRRMRALLLDDARAGAKPRFSGSLRAAAAAESKELSSEQASAGGEAGLTGLEVVSPALLVDFLYVVAELGGPPPGTSSGLRSLCSRLQRCCSTLTPGNLASVMVCLAVLKRRPAPSLSRAVFDRMAAILQRFSPQELANVLTAAGYLGLHPGDALLQGTLRRLRGFDLVQLAMFVRKVEQATPRNACSWLLQLRNDAKAIFAKSA
eukprot:365325-Chlamydomonas_euryale.AAC.32